MQIDYGRTGQEMYAQCNSFDAFTPFCLILPKLEDLRKSVVNRKCVFHFPLRLLI
jgi:hypothetical protein